MGKLSIDKHWGLFFVRDRLMRNRNRWKKPSAFSPFPTAGWFLGLSAHTQTHTLSLGLFSVMAGSRIPRFCVMGKRQVKCQWPGLHPAFLVNTLSVSNEKRESLYPSGSGKHRISAAINVQVVDPGGHTPLIGAHVRLAEIPRIRARTAVDDLHDDALADAARVRAFHATGVGHLVASAAVAGRAVRGHVIVDGRLAITLVHIDGAVAPAGGDVGRKIAGGGAVGAWGAWEGRVLDIYGLCYGQV